MLLSKEILFSCFIIIVAVLAYGFANFLMFLGINRRVYNFLPGECSVAGAFEDGIMDLDSSFQGTVIITTGNGLNDEVQSARAGGIFGLSTDNRSSWELSRLGGPIKVNVGHFALAHTLGPKNHNLQRLFLINNHKIGSSIEQYVLREEMKMLEHEKTIKSKYFKNIHDLAGVDGNRFYVTRYTTSNDLMAQRFEKLFSMEWGQILFYDGQETRIVESRISTPAGVVFDPLRRYLFVSSHMSEKLIVYQVLGNYNLQRIKEIPLDTAPYSLWMDIDGSLIATAHPIKFKHFYYETNPSANHSPTQVIRILAKPRSNRTTRIDYLYANDGASLSGATIAMRTANQLLLASPFQTLISCELPMQMNQKGKR
ncbi:unnamed protein product, partial [Mesorhabditis belari]|uniref:Uncharacterized protein n=1 Tax=Mesorhabditis belari TaxID=2138241 RepID=A0AAF3F557_9BILA